MTRHKTGVWSLDADDIAGSTYCEQGVFWVNPYLQLGRSWPGAAELIWFTPFKRKHWTVQVREADNENWTTRVIDQLVKVKLQGVAVRGLMATLPQPEKSLQYRVVLNGAIVFESRTDWPSQLSD